MSIYVNNLILHKVKPLTNLKESWETERRKFATKVLSPVHWEIFL
jgi:hypothetical protein